MSENHHFVSKVYDMLGEVADEASSLRSSCNRECQMRAIESVGTTVSEAVGTLDSSDTFKQMMLETVQECIQAIRRDIERSQEHILIKLTEEDSRRIRKLRRHVIMQMPDGVRTFYDRNPRKLYVGVEGGDVDIFAALQSIRTALSHLNLVVEISRLDDDELDDLLEGDPSPVGPSTAVDEPAVVSTANEPEQEAGSVVLAA